MKIGITSQNFRTITGHAGKSRRFLIIDQDTAGKPVEQERLDLPKAMSLHEYHGDEHPIFSLDVLITGGCGEGFIQRMAAHRVKVISTSETNPLRAAEQVIQGKTLPPAEPHDHHPNQHGTMPMP